jgi:predicted dehydrogenase
MNDGIQLAIIGGGQRGRAHVKESYDVRDANYLYSDKSDEYPDRLYDQYTNRAPSWVDDVSDLQPEIAAIMDPSEEERRKTSEICERHGDEPELFQTLDELLATAEFNAAIVASPPAVHKEALLPLMDRDIDILCEKGIVTTLADYDEIIDAHERSDSTFYSGFNLRSSPYFLRIKELLSDNIVGDLGMISCQEARGPFFARYAYSREMGGGALLDKNSHDFDVFNWFVESDPVHVFAYGGQHALKENNNVKDHASVVIEYADNTVATLELCLFAPFGERTRLYELRGDEGLLRTPEGDQENIRFFGKMKRDEYSVRSPKSSGHGGADYIQMKRFLRCVQGEEEPPATLIDAKKSAAIALGAEKSIDDGIEVRITDDYNIEEA